MKEKNYLQKMLLCMFAICILLAFYLLPGVVPQIKVYANEDAGVDTHAEINNPTYTFTTTNGEQVATTANPGETTVLIFGHKGCDRTRATLTSLASCNWVKRSDIRVIFEDAEGNSQEDVLQEEEGYQCPEMIFCYDTSYGGQRMKAIMTEYKNLFGNAKNAYPFIVLIDKNNKIQNILTGKKTSDEILNEIKKFENINETGMGTDSSDSNSGMENYVYGLKSIDGTTVSTKAKPKETTVLVFGYTTCGNTKATLQNVDRSDWINRSDIRMVYVDDITRPDTVSGTALSMVQEYAQNYTSGKIQFCYDHSERNHNIAMTYLSLYKLTGGAYPFIVYIDQNNKVQNITLGPKTADEIIAEIDKLAKGDQTTGGNGQNTSNTPSTPDTTTPSTPVWSPTTPGYSPWNPTYSDFTPWNPPISGTTTSDTSSVPNTVDESSKDTSDSDPLTPQESTYKIITTEDGNLQLIGNDGMIAKDQLVAASDGKQYYADENGVVAVKKIVSCNDIKYYAKEDGVIAHNEFCKTEDGITVFAQADGSLAANKVVNVDGKKYYVKSDSALAEGGFFTTAKGSKIYANASGELIVNQVFQADGKRYCAKPSGALVKSAFYTTSKGNTIYAKASGELITNKVFQVDGKRYCAKASGTLVKNAFYTLPSGKRVYANVSGEIVENQIFSVNGKKFYANKNGKIVTNKWVTVGNKKYYCGVFGKITKVLKIS